MSENTEDTRDRSTASIDATLRALSRVEPGPGLEARVLRAVQSRADAARPQTTRLRLVWAGLAAAAVALLLFAASFPWRSEPSRPAEQLAGHPAAALAAIRPGVASDVQPGVASGIRPEVATGGETAHAVQPPDRHASHLQPVDVPASLTDAQSHAVAAPASLSWRGSSARTLPVAQAAPAATAGNVPAPPLPLTEQERLLLRYVHRRDPKEVATLSPAASLQHEQADRAAYDEFFARPDPPAPALPQTPTGEPEWLPAIR